MAERRLLRFLLECADSAVYLWVRPHEVHEVRSMRYEFSDVYVNPTAVKNSFHIQNRNVASHL